MTSSALMNDWSYRKLDELGSVGRGRSRHRPRNDPSLYGGKYPFVQTGDVKAAEFYIKSYAQTYNEKDLSQSKLWNPGTLCITIAANIAETAILGIPACFPDSIVGFVAQPDKSDVRFVKYYIETIKLNMQNISKGTTQDNLSLDKLLTFEILTPPLHTQRKIAAILSAYDDLIENNTRRIKILEEMAQALYREWFVNFRFPGHEKVPMVDSLLGEIPGGWAVSNLDSVCMRITDGSHWSPQSVLEGVPMASVKDMHDWGFDIENCRKILEDDYLELIRNDCKPLKHDVLIAKDGSYLKHIFVVDKELDLVILSSIAILRTNDLMNPYFLAMYLKEPSIMARMKGYVSGVAVPRIVLKDFRKFEILIPPETLQEMWWKIAEPFISQCLRLIDKIANLRSTRDLLLPKLISGELDVDALDIKIEGMKP